MDSLGGQLTSAMPFRVRFPGLVPLSHLVIDAPDLAVAREAHGGSNLVQWLHRNAGPSIADLLEVTEDDVFGWRHIGALKRDRILGFLAAVDASAGVLLAPEQPPTVARALEQLRTDPDVELLLEWARFVGPAATLGSVEDAIVGQTLPGDVSEALERLRDRRVPEVPSAPDAESVLARWIDDMSPRDRDILQHRLVMAPARTLDDIGESHGVTRERIRQVQAQLTAKVPALLVADEWRPVRWEVFALRHRLGACAPLTDGEADLLSTAAGFPRALLLWLAGYRRNGPRVERTDFVEPALGAFPMIDDGPVIDCAALTEHLVRQGMHEDLVPWLIDNVKGLARFDGEVVLWPGNIVEKSYAVLAVRGTPMTADALVEAIGGDVSVRGLRSRLYEDPRICRMSAREVGLVAWGGEEYTSLPELMTAYLEEHGPSTITMLQDDLEARFDASRASVSMLRAAPIFATEGSLIWLRGPDEPFHPRATPHVIPGHYRSGDTLYWRIPADRELLRGSGRATPPELATFVGLQPGARTALAAAPRDVHFSWPMTRHVGPQLGSLKQLAEAVGADEGDDVVLVLDRAKHTASVKPLATASPGDGVADEIARLTELPVHACTSREAFAACVGVAETDLIDSLIARGDAEVAALAERLPA